ncbi:MAG: polyhydroxyalkanoate synthesis repressor PhaR [Proteobacteria bacterium]|jgi:polyhydroxyalkanoate synthesis repressor PhaR|nr:polyhydroxyalkanoate synthesis repressor PhaR [Pseudomonadota bacterium]
MTKERLIKKYANRRLYDASQSRHVTLDDIREFIIQGEKITVVEDKTGEDITRLILLQVIAEQEQFGKPILSTPLLESIIRFYGNGMQEFMSRYLEKSVETFSRQQETLQAQISKLMSNAPLATMGELAKQNLDYWTRMQESVAAAFLPKTRAEAPAAEPKPDDAAPGGKQGTGG